MVTRGNDLGYATVEIDRSIPGTSFTAGGRTVTLGENGAKAGSMAITILAPPMKRARGSSNRQVSSTVYQAAGAFKNALNLPANTPFREIAAAIKANGAFVGVFQEDTSFVTPSAVISRGTVSISAKMSDAERKTVLPGQPLYYTFNVGESEEEDTGFSLTAMPPSVHTSVFSLAMSHLYASRVGTPHQNSAVAFLSDGIRNAVRLAHAYDPESMLLSTLADFVLTECGLCTTAVAIENHTRTAQANVLRTVGSPTVVTNFFGVVPAVAGNGNWLLQPAGAPALPPVQTDPASTQTWALSIPTAARVFQNTSIGTSTWANAVAETYVAPSVAMGAYAANGIDEILVVTVKNDGVYIERHKFQNVQWNVMSSEKIEGLSERVVCDNYAQAAILILRAAYKPATEMVAKNIVRPAIYETAVEQIVAYARHAAIATTRDNFDARRTAWSNKMAEYNVAAEIQSYLTNIGISYTDVNISTPAARVAITRAQMVVLSKALKQYIGTVSNGHDAMRILGSRDNVSIMLGDIIAASMARASNASCVGTFVGFDRGVDKNGGIIVNVEGN